MVGRSKIIKNCQTSLRYVPSAFSCCGSSYRTTQKTTYMYSSWKCLHSTLYIRAGLAMGAFKYYVIKEVGGWGQKMAIFDDLQCCKLSKRWVGGPKKVKNVQIITDHMISNGP